MSDFSLLSTLKNHLQSRVQDQNFYLSPHAEIKYPCCLLEVDEVRNNLILGEGTVHSKVKFRTVCLHDDVGIKNSLENSRAVNEFLDGHTLKLKDGRLAIIKLMGSVVDISKNGEKKTVSHYYESLIRS